MTPSVLGKQRGFGGESEARTKEPGNPCDHAATYVTVQPQTEGAADPIGDAPDPRQRQKVMGKD